jgi:outer membrane protein assembly factor BamB
MAELALPLARTADWVVEYSPAEFSRRMPSSIVHFDGLLYVVAESSQLMAIDVGTGEIRLNRDLYQHYDEEAISEQFDNLFASPAGYIVGNDDRGRYYCWDMLSGEPQELWVSAHSTPLTGYVASDDAVYTSFSQDVRRMDLLSGEPDWSVPTLARDSGIVMGEDGTVIWWSWRAGKVVALRGADGEQLWQFACPNIVSRVVIDDVPGRCYLFLESEIVQCRELATGEQLWEFSWGETLSEEARQSFREESGSDEFYFPLSQACVMPDGLVLSLISGEIYRLDSSGALVCQYDSQATIRDLVAFENGLLASEYYTTAQASPWNPWFALFSRDKPDWEQLASVELDEQDTGESSADADSEGPAKVGFSRFVVLAPDSGEVLDSFEPELFPFTSMVPAGDKVVYGEILSFFAYLGQTNEISARRILAYPWIIEGDG